MSWGLLDWGDDDLLQWQRGPLGLLDTLVPGYRWPDPNSLAGRLLSGSSPSSTMATPAARGRSAMGAGEMGAASSHLDPRNNGPLTWAEDAARTGNRGLLDPEDKQEQRSSFDWQLFWAGLADAGDALNGRSGNTLNSLLTHRRQEQQLNLQRQQQAQKQALQQAQAQREQQQREALAQQLRSQYPDQPILASLAEAGMNIPAALLSPDQGTSSMQNYQFMVQQGMDPQEAMKRAFSGGTTINVGQQGPKLPANFMWRDPNNPAAGVTPIPGGPATEPTQAEREAAAFAGQQHQAGQRIEELEAEGVDSMSLWDDVMSEVPVLGNFLMTENGQRYRQAGINWAMTNLRDESGAAITIEEAEQAWERFFPQPGDSQSVIDQKRESRQDAEQAARIRAGRAGGGVLDTEAPDAGGSFDYDTNAKTGIGTDRGKAHGSTQSRRYRYDPTTGKLVPR